MTSNRDINDRLQFLRRAERLKDTLRSGHTTQGRAESVAEHTWRLTLLIITFADLLPDVDLLRLLKICILHDLGEAIGGDIPAPAQDPEAPKSPKERDDFASLLQLLPASLQQEFLGYWDEYDNLSSNEARIAKAMDKIETILQHNQGLNPDGFDYSFNLDYGRQFTSANPLTGQIRALLDSETSAKAARPGRD